MGFQHGGDLCLSFFAEAFDRGVVPMPPRARVLEVGCAEADWIAPMKALRPDLHITGIDWRKAARPAADVLVTGDVLRPTTFADDSFDVIVAVSSLEHVGLGSYDGDPLDPDGDTHAMENLRRWITEDGILYFDVPYRPGGPYHVTKNFRAYDEAALQARLLPGWIEIDRHVFLTGHADAPYISLVVLPA